MVGSEPVTAARERQRQFHIRVAQFEGRAFEVVVQVASADRIGRADLVVNLDGRLPEVAHVRHRVVVQGAAGRIVGQWNHPVENRLAERIQPRQGNHLARERLPG